MIAQAIRLYQRILVRRRFYRVNKLLYFLSLRGLGILNYEDEKISGERHFIGWLSKRLTSPLVIDVGANTGGYAGLVMSLMPAAEIYAFEPHPNAFQRLKVEDRKSVV